MKFSVSPLNFALKWIVIANQKRPNADSDKISWYCAYFSTPYFSLWRRFKMAMNGSIHYNSGRWHTVSSSFSMPVGISSTARLTAAKSIKSGISSSLYTGKGLLASIARARNDNLLILAYLRRRMDASAVKRWQNHPKCLSNVHISSHRHIFDDAI